MERVYVTAPGAVEPDDNRTTSWTCEPAVSDRPL